MLTFITVTDRSGNPMMINVDDLIYARTHTAEGYTMLTLDRRRTGQNTLSIKTTVLELHKLIREETQLKIVS